MSNIYADRLAAEVRELAGDNGAESTPNIKQLLCGILRPLFSAEGFQFNSFIDPDCGYSYLTGRALLDTSKAYTFIVEYDRCRDGAPVGAKDIEMLVEKRDRVGVDRLIIISKAGFTDAAKLAEQSEGSSLQLLDILDLERWIRRRERPKSAFEVEMNVLVRALSHEYACRVATDVRFLNQLEWRDLERMMARVMEGLGFSTRLTSSSKDGGKDLILGWETGRKGSSYILEIKHWRSQKRVGQRVISDFLKVVTQENRNGGIILSSSGFCSPSFSSLTETHRSEIGLGSTEKIFSLVRTYVRAEAGIWSPPEDYSDLLLENTLRLGGSHTET